MRHLALASAMTSMLAAFGTANAAPAPGIAGDIEVMTQNQYVGADLFPLIGAFGTPYFNDAVISVISTIAATHSVDRVNALAGEIATRRPHLAGLQEVWNVACVQPDPSLHGYPCTDPKFAAAWGDHLQVTLNALGGAYAVAGVVENFRIDSFGPWPGIPFTYGGATAFVQILDRDVILARAGVQASVYKGYACARPSADGCNYDVDLPLVDLGTSVKRGFVVVDATVGGKAYRLVNTHLENEDGPVIPGEIQSAQAYQLLQAILPVTPPDKRLIITGDTNSAPEDPATTLPTPYWIFAGFGLYDTWLVRPGSVAGLSCCQLEDLTNRASVLARRVDLVLSRELPAAVKDARLIGAVAADRLAPPGRGLWPSDHATVAVGLRY